MQHIEQVDLKSQYNKIALEVRLALEKVVENASFINGSEVHTFATSLAAYTGAKYVVPCANGTDALQVALMALDLQPGDEVILPAFTYVATGEVAALLQLKPVFVDTDPETFNIDVTKLENAITSHSKSIIPVHLFGQSAEMETILKIAKKHKLTVIEDNAQAIGAEYTFSDGRKLKAGTIGDIGTTSFFPSKNLGCYGDGGAIFTDNNELAKKMRMIVNHGQIEKYHHEVIGVNSRLDTIQAAVLNIKLKYLDDYTKARQQAAAFYDEELKNISALKIPLRSANSTHVFNQYTLKIENGKRNELQAFLKERGIPTMIYYPIPVHLQKAYQYLGYKKGDFPVAEELCEKVLSLPMHTELSFEQLEYITETVKRFFKLHG